MTRWIGIAALLLTLWALWWPIAAGREGRAVEAWFEDRRATGWQADAGDVSVSGFPLRYALEIADVALADPNTGWAWQGERMSLTRARHPQLGTPERVVRLPATHQLQTPEQRIAIAAERADLTLLHDDDALASARWEVTSLQLASDADWQARLAFAHLEAVADKMRQEDVILTLSARDLALPAAMAEALSDADIAPSAIVRIEAEARVTFDTVWRADFIEQPRPQPRRIALSDAALQWGGLTLRVAGTLDVDAAGRPEGELLLKATNWREMIAVGRASGVLPSGLANAIEGTLELASRLAGSRETLDVPLRLTNGRMRLGRLPIGAAPVLRLP
ncbi:MAG: DUF2125 domain-containing protein [Pseudomonadota bacterium]